MSEEWVAKNVCFSQTFSYLIFSTLSTTEHHQSSQKVDIWWVLHFFYLLFLYLCDPAGALFLRKFGPCSFGSIKWVTFRCLKPGLGRKWRWCGTPSNFLMSHTNLCSLSVEVNDTSSWNVVFTSSSTDQNAQKFVPDGILFPLDHISCHRVFHVWWSALSLNMFSFISNQSPGTSEPWLASPDPSHNIFITGQCSPLIGRKISLTLASHWSWYKLLLKLFLWNFFPSHAMCLETFVALADVTEVFFLHPVPMWEHNSEPPLRTLALSLLRGEQG